jgi:hypothetical protein
MAKNTTHKSSKVKAQTAIQRQPQQTAIVRAAPKTKALGGRIVRENGRGPRMGDSNPCRGI